MRNSKKRSKRSPNQQPQSEETEEQVVDLPNREVMSLIGPELLGGGMGSGLLGGTSDGTSPTGSPVPSPQPGTDAVTGIGPLEKFMPQTTPAPGAPYDPSTSSSSHT